MAKRDYELPVTLPQAMIFIANLTDSDVNCFNACDFGDFSYDSFICGYVGSLTCLWVIVIALCVPNVTENNYPLLLAPNIVCVDW